ncbi:MAG: DUF72 domain-containing protein [Hyphomicrobiales bacterium]
MIRVGVGGWTFEPWRGTFFPKELPKTRELEHASRKLTSIEVNGTYYSTQSPKSFKRWADETPEDFVFSLKAIRFATNRRVLAEAGGSIERFLGSGLTELKQKLGPILWQFAPTKKFDEEDFAAFLSLLPKTLDGLSLRHAVEVRHESFLVPAFIALARKHSVAIVFADSDKYPAIADVTADFVYARLQGTREEVATGYTQDEIKAWLAAARAWENGEVPKGLARIDERPAAKGKRDVFVYMISGAKVRAPAAAMALIEALG